MFTSLTFQIQIKRLDHLVYSLDAPGSTTPIIERSNVGVVNYKTGRMTLNPINIVSGKTKDAQQIMEIS